MDEFPEMIDFISDTFQQIIPSSNEIIYFVNETGNFYDLIDRIPTGNPG